MIKEDVRNEMVRLYVEDLKEVRFIAERFDVDPSSVTRVLNECGVKRMTKSDRLLILFQRGKTAREIIEELPIGYDAIFRLSKKIDLEMYEAFRKEFERERGLGWDTKEKIPEILDMYSKGMGSTEIARDLGFDRRTIEKVFDRFDLQ